MTMMRRVATMLHLAEKPLLNLSYAAVMVGVGEHVAMSIHRHLHRAVPGKSHHLLHTEALFDPQADREVSQVMPAQVRLQRAAKRLEVALQDVAVRLHGSAPGREHQIMR